MTRARAARRGARAPLLLAAAVLAAGCDRSVEGAATAAPPPAVPSSPEELAELLVTTVPSGLPRLPDTEVRPPAGAKTIEDVATYAADPERERAVLAGYGFRFGWERFWGVRPDEVTSVFVFQMRTRGGADAYARDLAANDLGHYGGVLAESPPALPGGCRLLTVEDPRRGSDLPAPAAISWCGHGVFAVSVTALAPTLDEAEQEVRRLLPLQLAQLPPGGRR